MKKYKVLVLDEDVLSRRMIATILKDVPAVEVRVCSHTGEVERIIQNEQPDVVLLDIQQLKPKRNSTFISLRMQFPNVSFVVLSPRTEEGGEAAVFALRNGAIDVITKPESNNLILFAGDHLTKRLPPIVNVAARMKEGRRSSGNQVLERSRRTETDRKELPKWKFPSAPVQIVVIGGCTGGPKALDTILNQLPEDLYVPVVVVQHFPKVYTRKLAQSLNKTSGLLVHEVYNGTDLAPGVVWLARGGYHCEVQQMGNTPFLRTHQGPRENNVRPSIDALFRSAARIYGSGVLGVVLSGYGNDGIAGARAIQQAGGQVIVQDPKDAVAADLPLSIIRLGLADRVGTAEQIGIGIAKRIFAGSSGFYRKQMKTSGSKMYQKDG